MSPARDAVASPLRHRAFVGLLVYRLFAILSYQIVAVTVGWHVYEITRDPWSLGLVGLAEVVPYFCTALFAGYAVDHLPRRRLGVAACIGLLATALILAWLARGVLGSTWPIYAAIALTGMVRAFLGPVYTALVAHALPRSDYARGAGMGSVVFQLALVIGPALGGGLIAWSGKTASYAVAAACAGAATAALLWLRMDEPPLATTRAPMLASIGEGLRFVFGHQILLGALALDMFAVLFGGAVALLPAFIADILLAGPEALGLLRAAPAAGAVAVGLWMSKRPPQRHA
ncbi:MAG TPA: MFS transporter, partial [Xanthomonadaceae bacterium]|nr:MFS transporter [Xanthomonadaceae bacterium]